MPDRFARVPAAPVAADPAAEVLALLRQVAADLHILAAGRRPDLCEADRAALADLLPAIARAVGTRFAWTARELTAHAVKADAALLAAIENATGPLDGNTARRIGRLLRRSNGATVGTFRVERIGDARDGAIWILREAIPRNSP